MRKLFVVLIVGMASTLYAATIDFNYQGQLKQNGTVANGSFNMEFKIFDALTGGTQISTATVNGVPVSNGLFTVNVPIDDTSFPGADRYLEVSVTGTAITPRTKISRYPYAVTAQNATTSQTAVTAQNLSGGTVSASSVASSIITGGVAPRTAALTQDGNGALLNLQNSGKTATLALFASGETSLLDNTLGFRISCYPTAITLHGNVTVTGTLSKSGGSFKIDHPQDPENKFLIHSFVESPEYKNVYDGKSKLDQSGKCTVTMPGYFETLNREFRYQLTAIGAPMPNLHISEEMNQNKFSISGGTPNGTVSWQVTGVRQDAFAKANPIVVEQEKNESEKGKYMTPSVYGKPDSAGIFYRAPYVPSK